MRDVCAQYFNDHPVLIGGNGVDSDDLVFSILSIPMYVTYQFYIIIAPVASYSPV